MYAQEFPTIGGTIVAFGAAMVVTGRLTGQTVAAVAAPVPFFLQELSSARGPAAATTAEGRSTDQTAALVATNAMAFIEAIASATPHPPHEDVAQTAGRSTDQTAFTATDSEPKHNATPITLVAFSAPLRPFRRLSALRKETSSQMRGETTEPPTQRTVSMAPRNVSMAPRNEDDDDSLFADARASDVCAVRCGSAGWLDDSRAGSSLLCWLAGARAAGTTGSADVATSDWKSPHDEDGSHTAGRLADHTNDTFLQNRWYIMTAPGTHRAGSCGETLVTRLAGTKTAVKELNTQAQSDAQKNAQNAGFLKQVGDTIHDNSSPNLSRLRSWIMDGLEREAEGNVHGFREQIPVMRTLVPPPVPTHHHIVGINIIIMNIMTTIHDVAHDDGVQGWDQGGGSEGSWESRPGRHLW